jgi:hypothetical protein
VETKRSDIAPLGNDFSPTYLKTPLLDRLPASPPLCTPRRAFLLNLAVLGSRRLARRAEIINGLPKPGQHLRLTR